MGAVEALVQAKADLEIADDSGYVGIWPETCWCYVDGHRTLTDLL